MESPIDCKFYRRFGVELELNTAKSIHFKRPDTEAGEIMAGSDVVSCIVRKASRDRVEIQGWDYAHNNSAWIIKYDMSCGIEINSPVLKGWRGLQKLLSVIDALGQDWPYCDDRCSLHVHVAIDDLNMEQLASVIAYYIKCEHVFLDSMPASRKNNRYCQPLGLTDLFSHDEELHPADLINAVSGVKYYSMNAYHFMRGGGFSSDNHRKKAIEFRIAENKACIDPLITKNWIRLLLHFVEVTKNMPLPETYEKNNQWSGLLWLNPQDVFKLLKFDNSLSTGMQQVKEWFMKRIYANGYDNKMCGIWSNEGRSSSREDFMEMYNVTEFNQSDEERIYNPKYIL